MLLQKTGRRIKEFISHRKGKRNVDEDDDVPQTDEKPKASEGKRNSWLSQTLATSEGFSLRRESSITKSRKTLHTTPPRPPSQTAHSSASSFCSCCDVDNVSWPHSAARNESQDPATKILYLHSEEAATCSGDAKKWTQIFSEPRPSPSASDMLDPPQLAISVFPSTIGRLEAASLKLTDSGPSLEKMSRSEEWSENVEQLIRETDIAFKAAGFAIEEGNIATERYDGATSHIARSQSTLRKQQQSPVAQNDSTSPPRRKISPKRKALDQEGQSQSAALPPSNTTTGPELTLTDVTGNVIDHSNSSSVNNCTSACQSPSQTRQLAFPAKTDSDSRRSTETTYSTSTDGNMTPIEPFHLEEICARLNANVVFTPVSPKRRLPDLPIPNKSRLRQENRLLTSVAPSSITDQESTLEAPPILQFRNVNFPSPPRSLRSTQRGGRSLPTISEISPLGSVDRQASNSQLKPLRPPFYNVSGPGQPVRKLELSTGLHSTPYTLTAPLFRHGPIRLSISSLPPSPSVSPDPISPKSAPPTLKSNPKEKVTSSGTGNRSRNNSVSSSLPLDWTAFQIALSGVAVDVSTAEVEPEVDMEDLLEWLKDLGFHCMGDLIKEKGGRFDKGKGKGRRRSEGASEMGVKWDGKKETGELEWDSVASKWKRKRRCLDNGTRCKVTRLSPDPSVTPAVLLDDSPVVPSFNGTEERSKSSELETNAMMPKRRRGYESGASLPDSPMEEINPAMLIERKDGDAEMVLMGFNLGHDLGDFLEWKSNHGPALDEMREKREGRS